MGKEAAARRWKRVQTAAAQVDETWRGGGWSDERDDSDSIKGNGRPAGVRNRRVTAATPTASGDDKDEEEEYAYSVGEWSVRCAPREEKFS